jgi:peptidoglycan/LPS O-acetylase OafA/YrhL
VAVIAVVAYHLWPDRVPAGFLGVDLFMVLSGFLITALLVDNRASGRPRLGRFWARRFRRLVPALLAVLTGVAVWVRVSGPSLLEPTVRGQGLASLLYVGNWKLIHDGTSYAALSDPPSPLLHLWSLAIEEQFYVLWPLAVLAGLALWRGRTRPLAIAAAVGAVASAALMAVWFEPGHDPLRLYFGTDTRAFAFLVGGIAFLAFRRASLRSIGIPALIGIVGAFVFLDSDAALYQGGFLAFAVVAAAAVVSVTKPGPLALVLDRAPLRVIGRVSYGIYLWHWPVIVFVRADNTPFSGVALLGVRIGLTALFTTLSWVYIEQPYRRLPGRPAVAVAVVGVAITAGCLVTLPHRSPLAYADVDVSKVAVPVVEPPNRSDVVAGVPGTVMIVGDSGMYDEVPALTAGFTSAGSTVVSTAFPGVALTTPPGTRDSWAATVAERRPDLVIVMLGAWDHDFVATNGDAAYAAIVDDTVTKLTAHGAHVMWLSVLPGDAVVPGRRVDATDLDRFYRPLPARYPGVVEFVDIGDSLAPQPGVQLRKPDGWHLCPEGAASLAHTILDRFGIDDATWRAGQWRLDPRYDDPPGGCPAR